MLTVLAAVPLLPFSEGLTRLLLTLSSTLGDSYLLNHSPIQRRMAMDNVRADIVAMLSRCEKLSVVAHPQGAAISYFALKDMIEVGLIEEGRVQFISVGFGLDKLSALDELNSSIEFSKTAHPVVPVTGIMLASGLIVVLWVVTLKLHKYMPSEYGLKNIWWIDVFASSDPVPNGPVKGPNVSHEIINSQALITDHTEYFSNNTDFLPVLVKESLVATGLDWRVGIDKWVAGRENVLGWVTRSTRKHYLMCGNWINRVFFIIFLAINSNSLFANSTTDSVDLLNGISGELQKFLSLDLSGYFQIIWFKALIAFFSFTFFFGGQISREIARVIIFFSPLTYC